MTVPVLLDDDLNPGGPGAEVMEAFMQFPVPLILTRQDASVVLVNAAMRDRFGPTGWVEDRLRGLLQGDSPRGVAALRSAHRADPVEVPVRVIRMPGLALLALDDGSAAPEDELAQLRDRVSQLERLAATDHLTGAWNRAHFSGLMDVELARSVANRQPVSLVLLDIDHFKNVNDAHGHAAGDAVLRELVGVVQSRIRASDVLFRWGGEEFAVLAGSVGYRGAERLAENLCRAVAGHPFQTVGKVTISLGVAEHVGTEDLPAWFARLDGALYAAKHAGRNRVVVDRRGNSDVWVAGDGTTALHLVWQEAYESGDPTIDGEHQELFVLANQLMDAAFRAAADPAAVRCCMDALITHTRLHFADEEVILANVNYGALAQHKRAHAGLLRRADHLKGRLAAGEASLGAIVEFLAQDVVARHLMTVDRAFFPLFEKRGTGQP